MYGASRLSPLGCAYYTFVGITILMFFFTVMTYRDWRVETAGVWATGQVVAISHCRDRHNQVISTVQFTVSYTDLHHVLHTAQTNCEYNTYHVGQSIAIRYLPDDPEYVLTRVDIGGGQGFPLIVLIALDVVFTAIVVTVAFLAMRASMRKRASQGRSAQPALIAIGKRVHQQPPYGRLPRRLRRRNGSSRFR